MTIRDLIELIDEERWLYPRIDDYNLATVTQTIQEPDDSFTIRNTVSVDHERGIVTIEAS